MVAEPTRLNYRQFAPNGKLYREPMNLVAIA